MSSSSCKERPPAALCPGEWKSEHQWGHSSGRGRKGPRGWSWLGRDVGGVPDARAEGGEGGASSTARAPCLLLSCDRGSHTSLRGDSCAVGWAQAQLVLQGAAEFSGGTPKSLAPASTHRASAQEKAGPQGDVPGPRGPMREGERAGKGRSRLPHRDEASGPRGCCWAFPAPPNPTAAPFCATALPRPESGLSCPSSANF